MCLKFEAFLKNKQHLNKQYLNNPLGLTLSTPGLVMFLLAITAVKSKTGLDRKEGKELVSSFWVVLKEGIASSILNNISTSL